MMNLFKKIEFWIAIAVIIGGIIMFLNLPTRVKKNEADIEEWKGVAIRQQVMTEILTKNQDRLIDKVE